MTTTTAVRPVVVSAKGAARWQAGHPWIYQNELEGWSPDAVPGDLVDLHDSQGRFLGRGYLNPRTTIAVRVLARDRVPVDQEFFLARIRQATALRERSVIRHVARWELPSTRHATARIRSAVERRFMIYSETAETTADQSQN